MISIILSSSSLILPSVSSNLLLNPSLELCISAMVLQHQSFCLVPFYNFSVFVDVFILPLHCFSYFF
jgi:hypothetical protein